MRLFLHLSMLAGADRDCENVGALIHPPVSTEDICEFLLAHIHHDLEIVGKSSSLGPDDTFVLIHILIEAFEKEASADAEMVANISSFLDTKARRREWEAAFAAAFIAPILVKVRSSVDKANHVLLHDFRLGNNPLLQSLCAQERASGDFEIERVQYAPALWIYQPRITIDHLAQTFHESFNHNSGKRKNENYGKVLHLFLHQEGMLRYLRFLPTILRLQRFLKDRYNRIISRSEAASLTVHEILESVKNAQQATELSAWIDSFLTVWDATRGHIVNTLKKDLENAKISSEEYEKKTDHRTTPLALLIPSRKGLGMCALAVTKYLINLHNDFMEEYSALKACSLNTRIKACDASYTEIVAYHPDRDLLPLVLSNCNYSLIVGSETSIEYDFQSLEKHIEEKFIRGRPRLDFECDVITFREEYTNAAAFQLLRTRIPQETLPKEYQRQIRLEYRHLTELCENLTNIDICIGFLVSVGGEPDRLLVDFMSKTLNLITGTLSKTARQCRLKHIENLWLLMLQEKAKLRLSCQEEPFDEVGEKYLEKLTPEWVDYLHIYLPNINLNYFLDQLFELIVLHVTVKHDPADRNYTDNTNHPLNHTLHWYIEMKKQKQIPELLDGKFPDTICVKHAIETWKCGNDILGKFDNRGM